MRYNAKTGVVTDRYNTYHPSMQQLKRWLILKKVYSKTHWSACNGIILRVDRILAAWRQFQNASSVMRDLVAENRQHGSSLGFWKEILFHLVLLACESFPLWSGSRRMFGSVLEEDGLCSAGCVWIYGSFPPWAPEGADFTHLGSAARQQREVNSFFCRARYEKSFKYSYLSSIGWPNRPKLTPYL